MCKVFFLFIVWTSLCAELYARFFWHRHKMIILRTTQNWWKQPKIQSGLSLRLIKKSCRTLL
jgi:hypothetical protein